VVGILEWLLLGENRAVAMGHGYVVVLDSMDEKIDVEFWKIPRQNVSFGAVEIKIVLNKTANFV
jgi:hypothetical protein